MSRGEYIPNTATKLLLHMNGNSNDSSGNGNNGTATGITYSQADGKFNQGANFNATSDKILIANEANFDFERTQPFTMSLWLKFNVTSGTVFVISKQIVGGNYTGLNIYASHPNPPITRRIQFGIVSTPTNMIDLYFDLPASTGKWENWIFTYNGNSLASGWTLYVNGAKKTFTTVTNNLTTSILNNVSLEIGSRNGALGFNGSIDEVIIETRVWTESEARKYYTNATKPQIV